MFKMNNAMIASMLLPYRKLENGVWHVSSANNTYLNARIYTGGDLSGAEINAFNSAVANTSASAFYTRNYTSAFSTLAGGRTLLGQSTISQSALIQRWQNLGVSVQKSVWRLSQFAPIVGSAVGVAGLLVLNITDTPSSVATVRSTLVFTLGAVGSGADIEMTNVNVAVGQNISLNDIEIDFQGLM